MLSLTVKKERIGPILGRHPWVFSGALAHLPEGLSGGMPVKLADDQGKFLAQGYFNSYSQIAVRIWSYDEKEEVNEEFFVRRVKAAYELRQKFVLNKQTDSCRVVHSENDFLPGLVVDKYGDYLSVQFHTRGLDFWQEQIIAALVKVFKPVGIYERSDVKVRGIEKGESKTGLLYGQVPERVKIIENGYKFWVDISGGQKTGFFLDQRDKRQALAKYVAEKNVLNCFSYTGGFSIYALGAGAKKVVSVDVSESALALAEENVKLNKLNSKKCEFICADARDYLNGLLTKDPELAPEKFDVIILDPPAYIKDRHKIKEGIMGYKRINELALRLLPSGGILVSASCSAHLPLNDFRFVLSQAAGRAGRSLQILETYTHGIDHPESVAFTEGDYLKCIFAQVG